MRISAVIGVLLLVVGVFVLVTGMQYKDTKKIVDVGDVEVKATDHRPVPKWVGIVALVGGSPLWASGWRAGRPGAEGQEWNQPERRRAMLETIAIILLVLWVLGLVSSYTVGGFIHILLVAAIIIFLIRILQGRRPV